MQTNLAYVFDRRGESAEALRNTILIAERNRFPRQLVRGESPLAQSDAGRMSAVALELAELASRLGRDIPSASTHERQSELLFLADSAAIASLVFDRYCLQAYLVIAQLVLAAGSNREETALWCRRYRKAEADLLSRPEADLNTMQQTTKTLLDPAAMKGVQDEMYRYASSDMLPPRDENTRTTRDWLKEIEAQL